MSINVQAKDYADALEVTKQTTAHMDLGITHDLGIFNTTQDQNSHKKNAIDKNNIISIWEYSKNDKTFKEPDSFHYDTYNLNIISKLLDAILKLLEGKNIKNNPKSKMESFTKQEKEDMLENCVKLDKLGMSSKVVDKLQDLITSDKIDNLPKSANQQLRKIFAEIETMIESGRLTEKQKDKIEQLIAKAEKIVKANSTNPIDKSAPSIDGDQSPVEVPEDGKKKIDKTKLKKAWKEFKTVLFKGSDKKTKAKLEEVTKDFTKKEFATFIQEHKEEILYATHNGFNDTETLKYITKRLQTGANNAEKGYVDDFKEPSFFTTDATSKRKISAYWDKCIGNTLEQK